MAQVTGIGTSWNLPNFVGELFTADSIQTPLLSMIGGLTNGLQTNNFEFPTAVLYDFPEAAQPNISETASATAPEAAASASTQETNVCQIFHEKIELTYAKESQTGRLSGLNTANQYSHKDETAVQIERKLKKIARDIEFTFLNGKYHKAVSSTEANKTRGLLELCTSDAGVSIAAGTKPLSKALLDQLFKEMADNGALFENMVLFCGAHQKQAITNIYAEQFKANMDSSRKIAGMNVKEIETDFFKAGVLWDRLMPADAIIIADIAHIAPVFCPVPGKGVLFVEDLGKTGASDPKQIYGQIGLAHGPAFLHGAITGLTTA